MRKILLFYALLVSVCFFSQNNLHPYIGLGASVDGGFSFDIGMKNKNSFGFYIAARGLNLEEDYATGIDYSDISNASVIDEEIQKGKPFVVSAGTIYNFRNSNFSVGLGLGYGIEQSVLIETVLYDFQYIPDEIRVQSTTTRKTKITPDVFLDYSFNKRLGNTLGLQVGYNTLAGVFGMVYFSF